MDKTVFIAGKAVFKSILTIVAFFTPDVFMSVWHTVHILSFQRIDINSYEVKSETVWHC